jgi:hypothetical protein
VIIPVLLLLDTRDTCCISTGNEIGCTDIALYLYNRI